MRIYTACLTGYLRSQPQVRLLTLGACARGLQYLVCVCVCVTSLLAPFQVNTTRSAYIAIGFLLGLSDFQLTDLSKMPLFLRKSTFYGYFVVSKRLCIQHVL